MPRAWRRLRIRVFASIRPVVSTSDRSRRCLPSRARGGGPRASSLKPPRWLAAVPAGSEEAQGVPGGIPEPSLAPEPRLVGRWALESDALGHQACDRAIQISTLQIDDHSGTRTEFRDVLDGQRAFAIGALEASVPRERVDDEVEAELPIEGNGRSQVLSRQGHLIQVHPRLQGVMPCNASRAESVSPTRSRPRVAAWHWNQNGKGDVPRLGEPVEYRLRNIIVPDESIERPKRLQRVSRGGLP